MNLKSLAKDTAIYGLSSIVGRFLNYLLVILHTRVIPMESGGYGIVSNLYAWTALLLAFLTFGMETTFFRFSNKEEENPDKVFWPAAPLTCADMKKATLENVRDALRTLSPVVRVSPEIAARAKRAIEAMLAI